VGPVSSDPVFCGPFVVQLWAVSGMGNYGVLHQNEVSLIHFYFELCLMLHRGWIGVHMLIRILMNFVSMYVSVDV
jgi:hypothetical protein